MKTKFRLSVKNLCLLILANVAVFVIFLLCVEGLSSYLLLSHDVITAQRLAEKLHTQYDEDLGWVNRSNMVLPDMYGPGISLTTNSQGFRNDHDIPTEIPSGKYRVICSGDSFTLGYGVSDKQTWCEQLTTIDKNLECVNMGQGGYGVDQACLWFKRDIGDLKYDIHILAFISGDFSRMEHRKFLGYGKPKLELESGKIVVRNVPVPQLVYRFPILLRIRNSIRELRMAKLLSQWRSRNPSGSESKTKGATLSVKPAPFTQAEKRTCDILEVMFEELKIFSQKKSAEFVLVHLPTQSDLEPDHLNKWGNFVKTTAETHDIPFVDLVKAFRALPDEITDETFITQGELKYLGAAGHYNTKGNRLVAQILYAELDGYFVKSGSAPDR